MGPVAKRSPPAPDRSQGAIDEISFRGFHASNVTGAQPPRNAPSTGAMPYREIFRFRALIALRVIVSHPPEM